MHNDLKNNSDIMFPFKKRKQHTLTSEKHLKNLNLNHYAKDHHTRRYAIRVFYYIHIQDRTGQDYCSSYKNQYTDL